MAEGEVEESGFVRIAAFDHPAHLLRCPGGGVAVFGQVPGAKRVFVVAHTVGETRSGVALVGEKEVVVVDGAEVRPALLIEDDLVETDAVALGVDVEFADAEGLVAGVAKSLCHGRQVRHGFGGFEDAISVGPRRSAGHESSAGGDADWAFAVGVGKAGAAAREFVESGREDRGVVGRA